MNVIEFSSPAPSCLVPLDHPAQGRKLNETNIGKTIAEHDLSLLDDYDLTDRLGYLERLGAWK